MAENLAMQIESSGFIRNNIDHSFYVKYDDKSEIEAMLSIIVNDILLLYKNEETQQYCI